MKAFKPRCWARRASDGALCESMSDERHDTDDGELVHRATIAEGKTGVWFEDDCAPNAGPDGRETAALRLWEIGTQIDLVAFLAGQHVELPGILRAIAARLRAGTTAATHDLTSLQESIDFGRELLASEDAALPENAAATARVQANVDLLTLAAEILRPFAEGR